MKSAIIAAVAFSSVAFATHGHAHNHALVRRVAHRHAASKRDIVEEKIEIVVTECWLGGVVISPADCDEGVRNGTLKFIDNGSVAAALPPATTAATTFATLIASPKPATIETPAAVETPVASAPAAPAVQTPVSAPPAPKPAPKPAPVPAPVPAPAPAPAPAPVPAPASAPADLSPPAPPAVAPLAAEPSAITRPIAGIGNSAASSVNTAFPDGQLDCDQFPEEYGAIRADWLGIGGWLSVQTPRVRTAAGYNNIFSQVKSLCNGPSCCGENSFCSYACPVGYLKSQWPSMQGSTGQSIGGVYCKNGKLHLTNPSVPTLCAPGASEINVYIKNKLSKNVPVCRTNYPGDEAMTIPLNAKPGETKKLACPDSSTYYKWEGKGTSAQYYMNMPGYTVEQACQWGEPGSDYGNWAPGNLGVGWSNGRAWVSITANHPTQMNVNMPYTVEILGGESTCRYQNGRYCTGAQYDVCSSEGCTVSSAGGDLTYVIS